MVWRASAKGLVRCLIGSRRGRRILAIFAVASCAAVVATAGANGESQLVKDWDNDGSLAPADCKPFDPAVYPGAPDKPDLPFEDTNCDGIDGNLNGAIFVDGGGGLDTRSGTRDFPKKTITNALVAAKAAGKDVYVAAGTYAGVARARDQRRASTAATPRTSPRAARPSRPTSTAARRPRWRTTTPA